MFRTKSIHLFFRRLKRSVVFIFGSVSFLCFIAILSIAFILLTDFGRNSAINFVSERLRKNGATLSIDEFESNKIKRIYFNDNKGNEFTVNDIFFGSDVTFGRLNISIGDFSMVQSEDGSGSISENEPSKIDTVETCAQPKIKIGRIIRLLRISRNFVKQFRLNSVSFQNETKLKNLAYVSEESTDTFFAEFGKSQNLHAEIHWHDKRFIKCIANIENISDFSGQLEISRENRKSFRYKLSASDGKISVFSEGEFANILKDIILRKIVVKHNNVEHEMSGKLCLDVPKLEIKSQLELKKIANEFDVNIPAFLADAMLDINLESDITDTHKVSFSLMNRGQNAGKGSAQINGKQLTFHADFSDLNYLGYRLNKANLTSSNLRNFNLKLDGNEWFAESRFSIDKNIKVDTFEAKIPKGSIVAESPFVIAKDMNCSLAFKVDSFKFFESLMPIKGSISGKIFSEHNRWNVQTKIPKILIKPTDSSIRNLEIYNGSVSGNIDDLQINAANLICDNFAFKNLKFTKKNQKLDLSSGFNNASTIRINGDWKNSQLNLSGNIKNRRNTLTLKKCDMNYDSGNCNIIADMSAISKKKGVNSVERGNFELALNEKKTQLKFSKFSLGTFGSFFDKMLPFCFVDGSFQLTPTGEILCGGGKFKISGLISRSNVFDLNLQNKADRFSVNLDYKNKQDKLSLDAVFPIKISKDWSVLSAPNLPLHIVAKGKAQMENLLNLPDDVSVKGTIIPDLQIGGNLKNPQIKGELKYTNANIAVSGLLLNNGVISLKGSGNKLLVEKAEFKDRKGYKATITGFGKLCFKGLMPNFDTDLKLNFNNFRLFHSDLLKLNLSGSGTMSGPIESLTIAGKLDVPFCLFKYSASGSPESKYADIVIENDPFLSKKIKEESDDFFIYNVDLNCPKVAVDGDIYQLEFAGDLGLRTYKRNPTLVGNLNLKKGKLDLFGKRFAFSEGHAKFEEEHPFDPHLYLLCSRNVDVVKIFLKAQNNPGKGVSIDLYSQPSYAQDIILSKMLFGKMPDELSMGEAAQLAHAVAGLSQRGSIFSILNTLTKTGLVDSISFSTEKDSSSSLRKNTQSSMNNKIGIKAGKHINDKVFISVNRKNEETSFDVDFAIDNKTSLKMNTLGEVGISWKYRY